MRVAARRQGQGGVLGTLNEVCQHLILCLEPPLERREGGVGRRGPTESEIEDERQKQREEKGKRR